MNATTVPTPAVLVTPTVQFNAQGTFAKKTSKKKIFFDVTNDGNALWFSGNPSGLFTGKVTYNGNGQWSGVTQGCTCIAVQDSVESQTVTVGVATPIAACPVCPPLPTP